MESRKTKQVFSISKKYDEVYDILEKIDNMSEFICQAIIEKYNAKKVDYSDALIDEKVRRIVKEMIGNNFIVVTGGMANVPLPSFNNHKRDMVVEEIIEETTDSEIDFMKDVFKNM